MNAELTFEGYEWTKELLTQMEARLAALQKRTDLDPVHRSEVQRSYEDMMRQYRRTLKLYEAAHRSEFPEKASEKVDASLDKGKSHEHGTIERVAGPVSHDE